MGSLVNDLGLACLAIDSGDQHIISGRTKLQKMIYFSKYLGWDIGKYQLHYYGPFSFGLADTIQVAKNSDLIDEKSPARGPYNYSLKESGKEFLETFLKEICDKKKVKTTKKLFNYLSNWSKEDLELTATIDFIYKNDPQLGKPALLEKVGLVKENFSSESIKTAHSKWVELKKEILN